MNGAKQRTCRTWLIRLRTASHLTQTQVADAVGISLTHYQWIEYGVRNPSKPVAERIAALIGFPVDFFSIKAEPAAAIKHRDVMITQPE